MRIVDFESVVEVSRIFLSHKKGHRSVLKDDTDFVIRCYVKSWLMKVQHTLLLVELCTDVFMPI